MKTVNKIAVGVTIWAFMAFPALAKDIKIGVVDLSLVLRLFCGNGPSRKRRGESFP